MMWQQQASERERENPQALLHIARGSAMSENSLILLLETEHPHIWVYLSYQMSGESFTQVHQSRNVQSSISHNSKHLEVAQISIKEEMHEKLCSMFTQRSITLEPKRINYRRRHQYGRNLAV